MSVRQGGLEGLASWLEHLCGLHLAARTGGPGLDPLRSGSRLVIMRSGNSYALPAGGPTAGEAPALDMVPLPSPPRAGARPCPPDAAASPSHALWSRDLDLPDPRLAASELLGDPVLRLNGSGIAPTEFPVPRKILDSGPGALAREVVRLAQGCEDMLCMDKLGGMPLHAAPLRSTAPFDARALPGLFEELNAMAPEGTVLDTVLLGPSRLALPGGAGAAVPRNVLISGGLTAVAHALVPDAMAYAVSSTSGPGLCRGPTAVRCTGEELLIRHYCRPVLSPGGDPRAPTAGLRAPIGQAAP